MDPTWHNHYTRGDTHAGVCMSVRHSILSIGAAEVAGPLEGDCVGVPPDGVLLTVLAVIPSRDRRRPWTADALVVLGGAGPPSPETGPWPMREVQLRRR